LDSLNEKILGAFHALYIYIHTYIVFSFTALKPNSYLWNNKKEEGDFGADEKIYFHIFKKEEGKIII
jgi:ABC-type enterochelin transport system permease subunit